MGFFPDEGQALGMNTAALRNRSIPAFFGTFSLVGALCWAPPAAAQSSAPSPTPESPDPYALRPSVMAGLSQWVLFGGGNLAGQVKFGRFVAEYSHGQSLHFDNVAFALTKEERAASVAVGMPWTTGAGFGFQITPHLHVLLEVKAHRYEVRDDFGGELRYTSLTIGPGVFYDIYLWKGLFVQPNVRYWPTVASTFKSKQLTSSDRTPYEPQRHDLVPFVNVNLGWTFSGY